MEIRAHDLTNQDYNPKNQIQQNCRLGFPAWISYLYAVFFQYIGDTAIWASVILTDAQGADAILAPRRLVSKCSKPFQLVHIDI